LALPVGTVVNDGRIIGYSVLGSPSAATPFLEFDDATKTFKWVVNPGGVGEANTTSNSGGGEGLAQAKVGIDLPFKSLTNSVDILLNGAADEIEIALSVAILATIAANTAKISYTDAAAVALNTAKITNATHTSEVTGAGSLAINKLAITNKTLVTVLGADHLLIADASDSDNLKKILASDFLAGGGATITTQTTNLNGGEFTTSSTSFVSITGLTITKANRSGGRCVGHYDGSVHNSGGNTTSMTWSDNGVSGGNDEKTTNTGVTDTSMSNSIDVPLDGLVLKCEAKVSTGTGTYNTDTRFFVSEMS